MNPAHVHLMINHLPLFAALFGAVFLVLGLLRGDRVLKSAALGLGVLAGGGGFLAAQSGERAEDILEEYAGVNEAALNEHEEAGEAAQWSLVALGALSLLGLLVPTRHARLRKRSEWLALVLFLASIGFVARAANVGGLIRHPEIRDHVPAEDIDEDEERGEIGHG